MGGAGVGDIGSDVGVMVEWPDECSRCRINEVIREVRVDAVSDFR